MEKAKEVKDEESDFDGDISDDPDLCAGSKNGESAEDSSEEEEAEPRAKSGRSFG